MGTKPFFVETQEVSARSVRKEIINNNLYLFALPLDQLYFLLLVPALAVCFKIQEIYNRIYLYSRHILHPVIVCLCSFKK